MAQSLQLNAILSQVQQLNSEDQLTLLQRISALLKSSTEPKRASVGLSALAGLGSELWKSQEEINNYLEEERQW